MHPAFTYRWLRFWLLAGALWGVAGVAGQPPAAGLQVMVVDSSGEPAAGVHVELRRDNKVIAAADTDQAGRARLTAAQGGRCTVTAAKDGFEPIARDLPPNAPSRIQLTLIPAIHHESVEVKATVSPVDQGASTSNTIPASIASELPGRPENVADALPMLPGVVRQPDGKLAISGSPEHRSAMIVNSADVTDPATGQFGLTVPIDQVERMNVYQTPFLAQYGSFTAGLVSVETRRGGDKWKWELNDPFPDFRIRSYHLRGLMDATPRLNVEGPLIPGKLYFSEGVEYTIRKTEVFELPFPLNQKEQQGINSFAQLDWTASANQLVTATVHVAPQRLGYVNLNYFNPEPTSPDASTHNYTGTIADKLFLWGGLLDNTFSATQFDARVWGQGSQDLTITPTGNNGNYFARQNRSASRVGWASTYSFPAVSWLGVHNVKIGSYLADSTDTGRVTEDPIDLLNTSDQLVERITFSGGQPFRMADFGYAAFAQDHWLITPRLGVDYGLRLESQELSESLRLAPRAGIVWTPFPNSRTVIRAGFGMFYDRVPLNVYSFGDYPDRTITMFDPLTGQISAGPYLYYNALGEVTTRFPLVFHEAVAGNFSPRSANGAIQVEETFSRHLKMRVGYTQILSDGLVTMNSTTPNPLTHIGDYLLGGGGQSRYRQLEVTARVRLNSTRELFFSYVRARSRGDLNDFANFLGSFPTPIVLPNQFGNLSTDLPNRFLAWGMIKLPAGFRIAPVIEYRNGFPYSVTDALQNYVGVPNANRYPNFLSLDARLSKDFKVNPKYTLRFSVSGFNITDHYNPEAFHNNIADPAFGQFFGQRGRHLTADFDVLF
jgi:Carboxypeptidase regulatory-like domain